MNPATMKERAITDYWAPDDDTDLQGMLRENLIGERIVIEVYTEIIRWLGDGDITSRRLMESHPQGGRGSRRRAQRPL